MPKTITKQSEIQPLVQQLLQHYAAGNMTGFWQVLEEEVLQQKVKFPLLEKIGEALYTNIPFQQQLQVTDRLVNLDYEGGYVIVATILAKRMGRDLPGSFAKAVAYYIQGDKWYVVDIIGHRVHGQGLLHYFDQTLPYLQQYLKHKNDWVKRSVGIAMHLAIKWGLEEKKVEKLLDLALTQAESRNLQVKKGIGWAIKTLAKFHPNLIQKRQIMRDPRVAQWFKKKIQIGLAMNKKS